MAFKLKKKIDDILLMDFISYAKFIKKEINRAAKLGELDVVVSAEHSFADGKESALILIGNYTGELAAFFKTNKSKDGFAKGKCFFETVDGLVTMHIAINAGKGKPNKIKKNGKKLWTKLGVNTEFYKGKLPELSKDLDSVNVGESTFVQEVDLENDSQKIALVFRKYKKAKKILQKEVLPLISDKTTKDTAYTNQHFKVAKTTLVAAASFLDKFEEVKEHQKANQQTNFDKITKDYPNLKRITAKIKKALMANNAIDVKLDNNASDAAQNESLSMSLDALHQEFEHLKALKVKAEKAIQYLNKSSK